MRRRPCLLIVIGSLVLGPMVLAAPRFVQEQYAVCDNPEEREFAEIVGVGCQDPGETMGCGAGERLSLKIRFDAPPDAQAKARLTLSGTTAVTFAPAPAGRAGNVYFLTPGEYAVTGFSADSDPAPSITVSVQVDQSWLVGLQSRQAPVQRITVRFVQMAGAQQVGDLSLSALYTPCAASLTSGDFVIMPGAPARKSVALIDGKRTACVRREAHVGAGIITVENLVPTTGCAPARATIFMHQAAVEYMDTTDAIWKPGPGDELRATKAAPVIEDIGLWLLYANCVGGSCQPANTQSLIDVAKATLNLARDRYLNLFGGVSFDAVRVVNLTTSTDSEVEVARTLKCNDPTNTHAAIAKFDKVRAMAGPDPEYGKRLDVVFVRTAGGNAEWCGAHATGSDVEPGSNLIVMTLLNDPFILAHEIGHALLNSGEHADNENGFLETNGLNNLMRPGDQTGGYLTIGQLYRMNLLDGSALNRHGKRPGGAKVACGGSGESVQCPAACFDVLRQVQPVVSGGPECVGQ
jgi:hypothetical protein